MKKFKDEDWIEYLVHTEYAGSQGTSDTEMYFPSTDIRVKGYMGFGPFYYALAYSFMAKKCVCVGSGGGFVPSLMRQAQIDIGFPDGYGDETVVIDANFEPIDGPITEENPLWGWQGHPYWDTDENHPFNVRYPEIRKIMKKSEDAFDDIDFEIDLIHIDGDHSYEGVKRDFELYFEKVKHNGIITLHDVELCGGVKSFFEELENHKDCEIINFGQVVYGDFTHEDNIFDKERKGELPEDFDPTIKPIHAEKYKWGGLGVIRKL
jgi:hypothetical protein